MKKVRKLVGVVLMLSLMICIGAVSVQATTTLAAGNSMAEATKISLGGTYSGTITASNSADYYRFSIPSSGRVSLKANAGIEIVNYRIYNSAGEELWAESPGWNATSKLSTININLDLTRGTYYFVAERHWRGFMGNYNFKLSFSSAEESFSETGYGTNNDVSSASKIALNTSYKGQIARNDNKDFYRFTMSTSGRVSVKANAGIERVNYRIHNSDGEELWAECPGWNGTSQMSTINTGVDLTKGTYYFVVEKHWQGYTGSYNFKMTFSSFGESFAETGYGTNNEMSSASKIALGISYKGQIAKNDEKDFYRFTTSTSGEFTLSTSAGIERINYRIYNSIGNEVWATSPNWNNVSKKIETSDKIYLKKGTYYFVIEQHWNGYTGNYSFNIKAPHVHSYKSYLTKATTTRNGQSGKKCACGRVLTATTIYYPKTISLSTTAYTYNGRVKTPAVTVKGSNGKTISSSNYTLKYSSGRMSVGSYKVTVTFKGNYSGTVSKAFTVSPAGTKILSLTPRSKGFRVAVSKQSVQTTGYQVQYATNSKFTYATTKVIPKSSTTVLNSSKLTAGRRYYVRVRTYKTIGGKTYYSAWSTSKTVTAGR